MLSKETRTAFIDFLERMCGHTRLSNKSLGCLMRAFHVATPFGLMFVVSLCSQGFATYAAVNLIMCLVVFFIFNGCFLSMLEYRLCGDEFTIADPFLEIFQMEITNETRVQATYWVAGIYMVVFFSIYYFRFLFKKTAGLVHCEPVTAAPATEPSTADAKVNATATATATTTATATAVPGKVILNSFL